MPGDRKSQIPLVPGGILVLAVAALASCKLMLNEDSSGSTTSQALRLRLGVASTVVPPVPNSVLWLAGDLGYYSAQGLDVDIVGLSGTPDVVAALESGSIDIGNVATEDVLRIDAADPAELQAIDSPDPDLDYVIVARDDIDSPRQLEQTSFGIAQLGSLDDTLTRIVLKADGVDTDQLTMISIGSPDQRARALVSGRISATTLSWGTWLSIRDTAGVRVLVDSDAYRQAAPIVAKVDAVRSSTLNTRADALRRFAAALAQARSALSGDESLWERAMARRRPDLSREALAEAWGHFHLDWATSTEPTAEEYARSAEFLYLQPSMENIKRVYPSTWVHSLTPTQ